MQAGAGEHRHAASGHLAEHAGVVAFVAHQIVAARLVAVLEDHATGTHAAMGHHGNGAVGAGHVVQCAPAGEIGLVGIAGVAEANVARVLVPRELHALFRALHHPLFVEEVDRWAEQRRGDAPHQLAEDEAAHPFAVAVAVGDEVALAAVGDAEDLPALLLQPAIRAGHEHRALLAQHGQRGVVDDALQHRKAVALELLQGGGRDPLHGFGLLSKRPTAALADYAQSPATAQGLRVAASPKGPSAEIKQSV